jgi:MOSC domain-containing protein YiiM
MHKSMIESIVFKPKKNPTTPLDEFQRIPLQRATLLAGYGIEGDAKGGHPSRQLNIMCRSTLDELRAEGFDVQPGQMGEQIIVSDVNLMVLQPGDRLQLGRDAVVEMTVPRTGCAQFEAHQGQPNPTASRPGSLGIMAKVVQGGDIAVGDIVRVLTPSVSS